MEDKIKFKVLVIGDIAVGKSSLVHKYYYGTELKHSKSTVEFHIVHKEVQIDNKNLLVQIWDTAGEEKFRAMSPQYYHRASGAIVVYDITRKETFESLDYWIHQCDQDYTDGVIPKILVGNKFDCENREVSFEEGKKFAEKLQIPFYETSKGDSGIKYIFSTLFRKIILTRNYEKYASTDSFFVEETAENKDKKKFSCCSGNTTNLNVNLGKPF